MYKTVCFKTIFFPRPGVYLIFLKQFYALCPFATPPPKKPQEVQTKCRNPEIQTGTVFEQQAFAEQILSERTLSGRCCKDY